MKLRFILILFLSSLLPRPALAASSSVQLLAASQVDEAIRVLEKQIQSSPNDSESYNLLCRTYFMIEDWDHGIAACERATRLDPQRSLYFLWLGRTYGEKADRSGFLSAAGLAKKVRTAFERAVALDPKNWEARTDLAEFYAEAPGIVGGGKDKAREQAKALMDFNPAMAHWVMARVAEKDKDPAAAEREYRAAITASHGGARAWFDLGNFYFHARRFDDMDQAFHALEPSSPDHPESFMHAAQVLLRAERDNALAIRLLRRYLAAPVEEGPAFRAHFLLGELLEKQGDPRGAAEQYRAALALFRGDARAKENLQRLGH